MSFRRENDKTAGLHSKTYDMFWGSHYGFGKADQPDPYAYICDFAVTDKRLKLRDGKRKNSTTGYPATVSSVMAIAVGGVPFMGLVTNGVLSLHPVADVVAAIRRYYTVREVRAGFSVSGLTNEQVNDLILRRPR